MSRNRNNAGIYGPEAGQRSVDPTAAQPTSPSGGGSEEPNAYLKTKILSASPAELRLMLIDGAIRFTEQARSGLIANDFEQSFEGFSKARAIVTELISGLNPGVAPELCDRLMGLYTFIFTRLVEASSERSVEILDEILQLFQFERETWALLVDSLARENAEASSVSQLPDATPPNGQASSTSSASLPTGGRISTTG